MNKKTLIKKATLLLEDYKEMEEKKRHYNGYNFHCINVKRHGDGIDIEELIKKRFKKYADDLTNFFNENYINNLYCSWLDFAWGDLSYNISNIEKLTKGSKNFCKSFKFIESQNDNNNMILSCGRSGGWACFQDNLDYEIEDILSFIIAWDVEELEELEVFYNYNDKTKDEGELYDINEKIKEIEGMMVEVETLKKYIYNFNKSMNFEDEIIYRIEEQIEEIESEKKEQAENLNTLKVDLIALSNKMSKRLEIHKKNKELKKTILRHLTGIVKILES